MSKSTGSKGSDNNSKGDNSSSSSSSDSESKGSSSGSGNRGGGNSGAANASAAASKAASDAQAKTDAANKASAESASKAQSDADAASSQQTSQHDAAVAAADAQAQKQSAETYGSFVQGVLDAAPVGYDNINKGRFGTDLSDAEVENKVSEVQHGFEANKAWNEGRYGDWASNKIGGLVDKAQGWGMEQTRELTQAPLDKVGELSRDPSVKGLALLAGGPLGLALTGAIGLTDSIADYAQGEKEGKHAAFQGLGDIVGTFGPPQVQMAYNAVTNPERAAKQAIGMAVPGDTLIGKAVQKGFGYAAENIIGGIGKDPVDSSVALGGTLTAKRDAADNSYANRVQSSSGTYTKPQVMTDDALLLEWQRQAQQQANKPRYSSSLLFNMA